MKKDLGIQRKSYQNPIQVTVKSYQTMEESLSEYLGSCHRTPRKSYQNPDDVLWILIQLPQDPESISKRC